ncbi:MAG: hypothetical protein GEU73_05980 [Chloroflexi bacterium]|nr:hypothetical protein [Chloroflexota bacterium]
MNRSRRAAYMVGFFADAGRRRADEIAAMRATWVKLPGPDEPDERDPGFLDGATACCLACARGLVDRNHDADYATVERIPFVANGPDFDRSTVVLSFERRPGHAGWVRCP